MPRVVERHDVRRPMGKRLEKGRAAAQALVRAFRRFGAEGGPSLAAAVAFYAGLSFGPVVLLSVTVGGFLGEAATNDVIALFERQFGSQVASAVEGVMESEAATVTRERSQWWRWVVGVGVLLVSASGVFSELQSALNRIWGVEVQPEGRWVQWLRKRLLSVGLVVGILFIMVVGLVFSSIVRRWVPGHDNDVLVQLGVELISGLVFSMLFAVMLRWLPDVDLRWRHVALGGVATATLFVAGKLLVGLYLSLGTSARSLGDAAGGLIAMLVWVYYSSSVFLLGAVVTREYAWARKAAIHPEEHAEWVDPVPSKA